ncbi:MAG: acyltransferase [Clostridiales bacterium]|nr:acyltransferase [Clostridiales bacterium]
MQKNGVITQEESKRITALRFILIVLVIFIHNNGSEVDNTAFSGAIRLLFSEILARTAVPLFFFISGYLLFIKPRPYKEVLKRKAKTLLLPYLLWNGLVLFLFWVGQTAPYVSAFFTDENNRIADYSLYQWVDAFLGLNYQGYPAAYQLWFIRDLILLTLLYPIGKKAVDWCPVITVTVLGVLWFMQWRLFFFSSEAALFFFLGAYAVKYEVKVSSFDHISIFDISLAYIGCVAVEWIQVIWDGEFMVLHKLGILLGCVFWLRISGKLAAPGKLYQGLAYLADFSFFVYAAHEPFLTMLRKVWSSLLPLQNTAGQLVQYFGLVLIAGGGALCAGILVRKLFPRIFGILTGGRSRTGVSGRLLPGRQSDKMKE